MNNDEFWKLLEPFHEKAAAFCRRLTGDLDRGDDLYQDALVTAMRRFHTLKDRSAFRPWLFRVLVNGYKNRMRGWWRRRRAALTPELLAVIPACDPRREYESRHLLEQVLQTLPPKDRALVILHEIEGWPIADLTGMIRQPEGTVKTRLFRARKKLRQVLETALSGERFETLSCEATYALRRSKTTPE